MRHVLTMLGSATRPRGGLATHIGRTIRKTDVLLAVSFRFYANEVVNVVEEAGQKGIDIIAISDSTLSPLARVLLPVPEHDYTFSRSLAVPMCLAQALVVAVAARVQQNAEAPHPHRPRHLTGTKRPGTPGGWRQ